ncbi:hypothetical protein AB1E19_004273 [Capra hircus]
MITLLSTIFSILVIIQFVLGNFANGFLDLVSCVDWVKRQKISSTDVIVTAMAVSRIVLLCVMLIHWYYILLHPALYGFKIRTIVHVVWTISNHYSTWLATSLSIFYLLKIANFSSLTFLHLKLRVKIVVISVSGTMQNFTQKTKLRDILWLSHVTPLILGNLKPFTMKMQLNGKGFQVPRTKIHTKAMQTVISFLLLFAFYFLVLIISIWSPKKLHEEPFLLLFPTVEVIYPSVHSFILIWGNRKLTQAFLLFLRQLGCWLKDRK